MISLIASPDQIVDEGVVYITLSIDDDSFDSGFSEPFDDKSPVVLDSSVVGELLLIESALIDVSDFSTKSLFVEFLLKKNQAPTPIARTKIISPSILFLGSLLLELELELLSLPPATAFLDKLNLPLFALVVELVLDKLNAIVLKFNCLKFKRRYLPMLQDPLRYLNPSPQIPNSHQHDIIYQIEPHLLFRIFLAIHILQFLVL